MLWQLARRCATTAMLSELLALADPATPPCASAKGADLAVSSNQNPKTSSIKFAKLTGLGCKTFALWLLPLFAIEYLKKIHSSVVPVIVCSFRLPITKAPPLGTSPLDREKPRARTSGGIPLASTYMTMESNGSDDMDESDTLEDESNDSKHVEEDNIVEDALSVLQKTTSKLAQPPRGTKPDTMTNWEDSADEAYRVLNLEIGKTADKKITWLLNLLGQFLIEGNWRHAWYSTGHLYDTLVETEEDVGEAEDY